MEKVLDARCEACHSLIVVMLGVARHTNLRRTADGTPSERRVVQPTDRVDCGLCWNERREVHWDRPGTQNWYGRLRQALRARSTLNQYQSEVGTTRDQETSTAQDQRSPEFNGKKTWTCRGAPCHAHLSPVSLMRLFAQPIPSALVPAPPAALAGARPCPRHGPAILNHACTRPTHFTNSSSRS